MTTVTTKTNENYRKELSEQAQSVQQQLQAIESQIKALKKQRKAAKRQIAILTGATQMLDIVDREQERRDAPQN